MYGEAAITSMTIMALLPRDVPTMKFATGSMATIRMIKGMERKKFTMMPSRRLSQWMGQMPSRSVMLRITPSGRPIT